MTSVRSGHGLGLQLLLLLLLLLQCLPRYCMRAVEGRATHMSLRHRFVHHGYWPRCSFA